MKTIPALALILALAGCGEPAAPPAPPPPPPAEKAAPAVESKPAVQDQSPETAARLIFEAGKKLEDFHALAVRYPTTKAGRRAMERCLELEADLVKATDREFAAAQSGADTLCKAGRFADAIASLRSFGASTTKESLRGRTDRQIERVENDARRAYVEAVRAARQAVAKGRLDEAAKLLKTAAEKSTVDVRDAADRDLDLLERYRAAEEERRLAAAEAEARKAFGDRATPLLQRIRERAYAEVLKELDAAAADPALAPVKDRLIADRAAVASAQTFWEAIQKTLKSRLNQDVHFKGADGKPVRGVLKKINDQGLSVRLDAADVPLASLHSDQLLLLAINPDGLPEDSGASYAAAAMWFFLEGRAAESRIELATADEMKADITLLEAAWRRGFFRMAQTQ
jgi:hypothetical protein